MTTSIARNPSIRVSAAARRRRIFWTQRARTLIQLAFATFILYTSVVHNLAVEDGTTPSIDALCPFGGLETAWQFFSTGGQYIPKTHQSNLILFSGLLLGTLVAGGAFCGWVCPFGAVQDLLTWIRTKLRLPELHVPARLDRILRYGRYGVLILILYQTIVGIKLWFADFDPYRTLFGLGWLFEFDPAIAGASYLITVVVLGLSLFVERGWCRYACPLGGAISLVGKFSLLRIRRTETSCKGCALCERPCPVKLNVATADTISSNCIGCLACVESCPRHGALEVQLAPIWFDFIRNRRSRSQTEASHAR
jgi:polyferredoxin